MRHAGDVASVPGLGNSLAFRFIERYFVLWGVAFLYPALLSCNLLLFFIVSTCAVSSKNHQVFEFLAS